MYNKDLMLLVIKKSNRLSTSIGKLII